MNCRVQKVLPHKKAFTAKFPPEGARRPETEKHCTSLVFPDAPEPTPGGAGGAATFLPLQSIPQPPSLLSYALPFPLPQLLLL